MTVGQDNGTVGQESVTNSQESVTGANKQSPTVEEYSSYAHCILQEGRCRRVQEKEDELCKVKNDSEQCDEHEERTEAAVV